jgi:hypothetical protein
MSTRFPYSPVKRLPIPALVLDLSDPAGGSVITPVSAHLDTAADMTIVPLPLLRQLGIVPIGQLSAKGFGGVPSPISVYRVRLTIAGVGAFTLPVLGHSNEPHVLIGRDILNQFRITFDGPNQVTEFH